MDIDNDDLDQLSVFQSYSSNYQSKVEFEEIFGSLNVDLFGNNGSLHGHSTLPHHSQINGNFKNILESFTNTMYFFTKKYEAIDRSMFLSCLGVNKEDAENKIREEGLANFDATIKSVMEIVLTPSELPISNIIDKIFDSYSKFIVSGLKNLMTIVFSFSHRESEKIVPTHSKSEKKIKRPWSKEEEQELLELMKTHYPMQIPADTISEFIKKYSRSKSSFINKIQKLKSKFVSDFESQENTIIQSIPFIKDFKESEVSFEQTILNAISAKGQLSYNQLLHFLEIPKFNLDQCEQFDKVLYKLLNEKRILCDERIFVELTGNVEGFEKRSAISDKIEKLLSKLPMHSMSFDDLKDFIMTEFPIIQKDLANLDRHLTEYLNQSGRFALRNHRVFY
jgi:hypothetical protein